MFAKYALPEVLSLALAGTAVCAVTAWYFGWWAVAPAVFFAALLSFYRDPPRGIPRGDDLLVSPADGWIVDVQLGAPASASEATVAECDALGPAGERRLLISIFLTVADVHLNRVPCDGTIRDVRYRRGEFLNALKKESITRNEQNTLIIAPAPPIPGPVHVTQIAGGLARRIVCAARAGDKMTAGQRFGMIKLGSRTILTAPADERWEVLVRVGQHVRGGATVLARLRAGAGVPAGVGTDAEDSAARRPER